MTESLYTTCTGCGAVFEVTLEQLQVANGAVRCGVCGKTFNARESLRDQPYADEAGDPHAVDEAEADAFSAIDTAAEDSALESRAMPFMPEWPTGDAANVSEDDRETPAASPDNAAATAAVRKQEEEENDDGEGGEARARPARDGRIALFDPRRPSASSPAPSENAPEDEFALTPAPDGTTQRPEPDDQEEDAARVAPQLPDDVAVDAEPAPTWHLPLDEEVDDGEEPGRLHGASWLDDDAPVDQLDPLLLNNHQPRRQSLLSWLGWSTASAVLLLAALGQATVYWRNDLLQLPWLHDQLVQWNEQLGTPLDFHYDVTAYEFVERPRLLVKNDLETTAPPSDAGADANDTNANADVRLLDVRADVANAARVPQPLPHLRLILEDRWGRPVAVRTLVPRAYLADGRSPTSYLAPGERVSARVTVTTREAQPEAYSLDICLPFAGDRLDCGGGPTQ